MDCHLRAQSCGRAESHSVEKTGSHVQNPFANLTIASGQFIAINAGALSRRIGRFSFPRNGWVAVILCLFFLTGCASAGSAPPGVAAAVFSVVVAVWKLRKLGDDPLLREGPKGNFFTERIRPVGEHVKFFLRWRAQYHLGAGSNEDSATQKVASEYDQVKTFVAKYVGLDPNNTSTLIRGTDQPFAHLDFTDVMRILTTTKPIDSLSRVTQEEKRWVRAMTIVWRAAALEQELWIPTFSEDALKEILDRRLRITEQMLHRISGTLVGNTPELGKMVALADKPTGPWPTTCRVRLFEYPELDADYADQIGAANIGAFGAFGDNKVWRWQYGNGGLIYAQGNGRRIRNDAAPSFPPTPGLDAGGFPKYSNDLKPVTTAAEAVDHLFTPSTDWWDRSWMYCDHVLSALHIEAFRFGKRRRTGNDDLFNSVVTGNPEGWVKLRPLLPPFAGDSGLMTDDHDKPPASRYFARHAMPQVQLGDHVVFYNSIMYGLLSDGPWSLENALVIELGSKWESNDVGDSISLMGHGTGETYAGRFREDVTGALNSMLNSARAAAKAAGAAVSVPWVRSGAPLVKWAPYGENWTDANGQPQAAWWLRIPFQPTANWQYRALGEAATKAVLPDAVQYDPGMGFTTAPPTVNGAGPAGAVYFPLWVPAQEDTWTGYIKRRKNGSVPSTFVLEKHAFHGNNIPAFAVPGEFVPAAPGQPPVGSRAVFTVRPIVAR